MPNKNFNKNKDELKKILIKVVTNLNSLNTRPRNSSGFILRISLNEYWLEITLFKENVFFSPVEIFIPTVNIKKRYFIGKHECRIHY